MTPQMRGMNSEVCRWVLKEYKILCAEVILREDITVDQFIDVKEWNRAYIPVLYVFNKIDSLTIEELDILDAMPNYVPISRYVNFCFLILIYNHRQPTQIKS